ncbi:MAG: ABC transporter substrate-binding protein [Bacteroidota bacterium]|nr:ABC transporter substrate-binding protein [Bacteroidota bacterium]
MHFKYSCWLYLSLFNLVVGCKDTTRQTAPSVLHYNQPNFITSLDPAFAKSQNNIWAVDHIYNQLIDLNDSLQLVPELATLWKIEDGGTKYTFQLRRDVYFHEDSCFVNHKTRLLNAHDVVFSFSRLLDPELAAPGSWVFSGIVDSLKPFYAENDSTFIIQLKKPFSPLLKILTMQYCSIVPKEAVDYYGKKFALHPVGTGPFRIKKWIGRQGLFLSKNEEYFIPGAPLLEGVRISFIEDRNTAYLEFLKNKIDFFSGLQSGFALQLLDQTGNLQTDKLNSLQYFKQDFLNTEYLGFNLEVLPKSHALQNSKVRQALNYAIDKKSLIRNFRYGVGTPAHAGFIPKGLKSYEESTIGYAYNAIKAKELLDEAGYYNLPLEDAQVIVNTNKEYLELVTFITRQWQEIGIKVTIELLETATLREKMRQGSLACFRASWIADYPDEESFMAVFYSQNDAPPNYMRFKSSQFDVLYDQSVIQSDETVRKDLFRKMDAIIIKEAPVVFLYYDQTSCFAQNHVKGLKINALNLLKLETVNEMNH